MSFLAGQRLGSSEIVPGGADTRSDGLDVVVNWQAAGRVDMADTAVVPVPAVAHDLRWWAERDWTGGVQLDTLTGFEQFAIRTRNTTYEMTVLVPATGEILLRGGTFFPVHTRAQIVGCSLGGSTLKMRAVHVGFSMELMHDGHRIMTTRVQEINPVSQGPAQ